jgi:hypothetical protein
MTGPTRAAPAKTQQSYGKAKVNHIVDVSYAASQAHEIVNVALHWEYSPHIILIFFQGRGISIMSKTNTWSNSNEYY